MNPTKPTKAMRELAGLLGMRAVCVTPDGVDFAPDMPNEPNYLQMDAEHLRDLAETALQVAGELDGKPFKAPAPGPPPWLARWVSSGDTGISSKTIAHALTGSMGWCRDRDAPYDGDDVGRCIRLLDLAAENGEDWRARLPEVAAVCPAWDRLVPIWPVIEAAYHEDVAADRAAREASLLTKRGKARQRYRRPDYPPSRCWWLLCKVRGAPDPYAHLTPHPFAPEVTHG